MPRRPRRVSVLARVAALERERSWCRTCAAYDPGRPRLFTLDEFERFEREHGPLLARCPECGAERQAPVVLVPGEHPKNARNPP